VEDQAKIQKQGRGAGSPWLRFWLSALMLALLSGLACYHRTCTYLLRQGRGQLRILLQAEPLGTFRHLSPLQMQNLALVDSIKRYSVHRFGYDPTDNYTKMYDHGREPVLWVVTASEAFSLAPVYWSFPVVGRVTYKGFFDRYLASLEYLHLVRAGYDAEVAPVTAYSSLGWFSDPLFSGMLERSKGAFCNLLFHELFHATYYKPGNVNLNENLASFVAHKATIVFLKNDTAALHHYLASHEDQEIIRAYLRCQYRKLNDFYESAPELNERKRLKAELFGEIADSLFRLPLHFPKRVKSRASHVISSGNAYFVGFKQYESLQDSLERVFNKNYRGNLKIMVHDLKRR
jgi:predicted aminopeptidase